MFQVHACIHVPLYITRVSSNTIHALERDGAHSAGGHATMCCLCTCIPDFGEKRSCYQFASKHMRAMLCMP
jgi:hypothetical protein